MNMNIIEILKKMQDVINLAMTDGEKFDNGNNAAGTRVRKHMQELKNMAQDVRVKISEIKNEGK
jgi:hypothetical protein